MSEQKQYPIIVKCPKCNHRILDKVSETGGIIALKCPHCGNIVKIDLSYRKNGGLKYRIVIN